MRMEKKKARESKRNSRKKGTKIVLCFLMCLFLIGYGDVFNSGYFVSMKYGY